jgi:flagellar protein FlaG
MEAVGAIKSKEIASSGRVEGMEAVQAGQNKTVEQKEYNTRKKVEQAADKAKATSEKKIERIAKAMDNYVKSIQRDLKISVHKATGRIMVKVVSKQTGETIREIPPEELLNLGAKMEEMAGVLFSKSA